MIHYNTIETALTINLFVDLDTHIEESFLAYISY